MASADGGPCFLKLVDDMEIGIPALRMCSASRYFETPDPTAAPRNALRQRPG
jgi:hypothetical protein